MRGIKIVGIVLGVMVLLVVGAGCAVVFGGGPAVKWVIEHPVSSAMARTIKVARVEVRWGAPTRIVLDDLHVANASWDSAHEMLAAKRVEVEIFARTLIWGPVRIPSLKLDGANLLLEKSDKGEGNWTMGVGNGAPKKRTEMPQLQHFEANDSTLVYRNEQTKAETDLGLGHIALDDPDPSGPVKIAATGGTFQKLPLKFTGQFGAFNDLRDASKPYPVKLDGTVGKVTVAVDGTIKEPLDFNGLDLRLSLGGARLDELADAMGVPMPELPDFRGTSKLRGGDGQWRIDALTLKVGNSDLAGGIDINTNEKVPRITANLTSSAIDLADFKGLYGGKPDKSSAPTPPDTSGRVIPDTQISVKKLPGINITLKFDGASIKANAGLPFERVILGIKIENGELTVDPLTFHVALGDVALHAHFNPFTQDTPPKLDGHVDIQHVDLHKLLGGPNMPEMVKETAGTAGGFITFDTSGVSLREFLGKMNGDVGVFVENGQMSALLEKLAPLDVLEALGVYITGDKPQPINCIISRFDVKTGKAAVQTFLVDTPATTINATGDVNFADETLGLHVVPYNKGFAPLSLRTPIDVGGTFKKPDFHVETGTLIARMAAAAGLGVLFPPAALLPLVDTGLGADNACKVAYAKQQEPGNPEPKSGSSLPPNAAAAPAPNPAPVAPQKPAPQKPAQLKK